MVTRLLEANGLDVNQLSAFIDEINRRNRTHS